MARDVKHWFQEDNQAAIQVVESGRSPSMRHIDRTNGVYTASIHEYHVEEVILIRYVDPFLACRQFHQEVFREGEIRPRQAAHRVSLEI